MSKLTTNTADLQAILDKVNALPDVGSAGGDIVKLLTGTMAFDSETKISATDTVTIEHGLGAIPMFFVASITTKASGDLSKLYCIRYKNGEDYYAYTIALQRYSSSAYKMYEGSLYMIWDEQSIILRFPAGTWTIPAGQTMTWSLYGYENA